MKGGRKQRESPNHFTTESLPGKDKKFRHTCKHCAQLGPGGQAQGAVRVVAAQRVPSTKATEHLAICEGLSGVEQRKWEALIRARGGVKHSLVTHDSPFEAAASGQGMSKRSRDNEAGGGWGGGRGRMCHLRIVKVLSSAQRWMTRWLSLNLPQGLPRNRTSLPSLGLREYVHTYISHINKISLAALSHRTHTLVETNNIQIKANNVKLKYNSLTLQSFPGV